MSDQTMFVQFPHPGREHRPAGKEMPWNTGEHARKFLVSQAVFVEDGRVESGSIGFWGEWEPQSRVVAEFRGRAPQAPRYVHEPYLQVPTDEGQGQNTDPLVFGDCFRYSNCRQLTRSYGVVGTVFCGFCGGFPGFGRCWGVVFLATP